MTAPLENKLAKVEWGKFKIGDLFEVSSPKKRFDANKVDILPQGKYPYIVRTSLNNGQRGFIEAPTEFLNSGNTISFGQDTATMFYQKDPYFTGDKIKVISGKNGILSERNALFFIASMAQAFKTFSWGNNSFNEKVILSQQIDLPAAGGQVNLKFMESFIAELELYLEAAGLKDTVLTEEEKRVLNAFENFSWAEFNLKDLFGKSTRGKRLKSDDRFDGELPFVTAGEADEGISAFISNKVEVFSKNTTTIDMFGSAKYRNYDYGADDHVAVVHTEQVPKYASIFVTSAIHKAAHTGKFSYSRNFYAKDADELNIMLPVKEGEIDYAAMNTLLRAIEKIVIDGVVDFADRRVAATKKIINRKQ